MQVSGSCRIGAGDEERLMGEITKGYEKVWG